MQETEQNFAESFNTLIDSLDALCKDQRGRSSQFHKRLEQDIEKGKNMVEMEQAKVRFVKRSYYLDEQLSVSDE